MGEKPMDPDGYEAFLERKRRSREAQRRKYEIEQGLYIEPVDSVPKGFAAGEIAALSSGLAAGDREQAIAALEKIGNMIHAVSRQTNPVSAKYEQGQDRYLVQMGSKSGGNRLIINTDRGPHKGNLIFPDVASNQKGLKEAFEQVFGDRAQNVGTEERPYYLVELNEKPA